MIALTTHSRYLWASTLVAIRESEQSAWLPSSDAHGERDIS
jgi:hypothetical protein